jgi:hypothetical protein
MEQNRNAFSIMPPILLESEKFKVLRCKKRGYEGLN